MGYQVRQLPYVQATKKLFTEFKEACSNNNIPPLQLLASLATGHRLANTEPRPESLPLKTISTAGGDKFPTPFIGNLPLHEAVAHIFLGAKRIMEDGFLGFEHGNYKLGLRRTNRKEIEYGVFWNNTPVAHMPMLNSKPNGKWVNHFRYSQLVPDTPPDFQLNRRTTLVDNTQRVEQTAHSHNICIGNFVGKGHWAVNDFEPPRKRLRVEGEWKPSNGRNKLQGESRIEKWDE